MYDVNFAVIFLETNSGVKKKMYIIICCAFNCFPEYIQKLFERKLLSQTKWRLEFLLPENK